MADLLMDLPVDVCLSGLPAGCCFSRMVWGGMQTRLRKRWPRPLFIDEGLPHNVGKLGTDELGNR